MLDFLIPRFAHDAKTHVADLFAADPARDEHQEQAADPPPGNEVASPEEGLLAARQEAAQAQHRPHRPHHVGRVSLLHPFHMHLHLRRPFTDVGALTRGPFHSLRRSRGCQT